MKLCYKTFSVTLEGSDVGKARQKALSQVNDDIPAENIISITEKASVGYQRFLGQGVSSTTVSLAVYYRH